MNGDLRFTVIIRFPGPLVRLGEFLEYLRFFGRGSLGRQPRRDRFDRLAQQVQAFEIFQRQLADPCLFARLFHQQAFTLQPARCLDHGHRAAPQRPGQAALRQPLTGDQVAAGEHQADALVSEIGCGFGCGRSHRDRGSGEFRCQVA